MVIGSHNAWSYAKPKKLWMKLIKFTAKCQKYDIQTQYEKYGSRCFDLRVKFDKNGDPMFVHNVVQYDLCRTDIAEDLRWLNDKGDAIIRVILDVRKKKTYTDHQIECFKKYCEWLQASFTNITFMGGQNLYDYKVDYDFGTNVTMCELYSSVTAPKIIDDWYPWVYAKLNNKKNIAKGTDALVLLIDFVNIQ